ncbi:MAG TPA: DEAD/DEAH box helicase [Myxococcota bacterium]|nr:DEAD/DEAH box helicase [Myxococcota bacterium]
MTGPLDTLFAAIRSGCSSSVWSQGVELARAGAVSGEREDERAVVLRVATRGGLVSPSVHLEIDPPDWNCECASREDVCEHAAAAVIALRQARRAGERLPGASRPTGRIAVRLSRRDGALHFERAVVLGDREEPLHSTLAALSSGRVDGPAFVATPADLALERALGPRLRGELPRGLWPSVLAALAGCTDVALDGAPVRASAEPIGFVGRLEDAPSGFRLSARRDPRVVETFADEVALLGDGTLAPLGASLLSGRELEELTRGRIYRADEAAELATDVLPSLRERIPVEIATDRLPRTSPEPPRIALSIERDGDALAVLPLLVYGDPPTARVDAGRLVPLGGPLPLRDEAAERALVRRLAQELELAPGRRFVATGREALELADRLRRWPEAAASFAKWAEGERIPSGWPALARFTRVGPLAPRFDARASGAAFEVTDESGRTHRAATARVLEAWRAGESWVALDGGGFAELPAEWLASHGARVADLLAARGDRGELPAAALPELAVLAADLGAPVPEVADAVRRGLAALAGAAAPASAALPPDLTAVLRGYQSEGVRWLAGLRELALPALLADDMGLGKTLQALCAVRGRTLVVAPTSVVPNWAAEAERFRPALRVCVYHGPARALDPSADLTLTSYALLRLDSDALCGVEWDTVVLDESQAIKNADSQVARAAHRLPGRFRIALTGTPIENRLAELWSQFQFLSRGWLGSLNDFRERYAKPIADGDAVAADRLRARVRPFVLRRHKRDVAPELPPRTEVVLHVELADDERQVYDAIRAATREDVATRFAAGGSAFQVLEALLRLRQAACDAALVPGGRIQRSAKLEVLRENLEESVAEGHKALVFSQWTSLLDRVEPVLRAAELPFARLDGSTRDRAAVVDAFQSESGPPVMLVSLRAGGTGLNLTAADSVFILDPWWNPAVEEQAADRAHRIGQTRPVMVYRLVATGTVEERVLALQARKRALTEAALGAADATAITREELLELLR